MAQPVNENCHPTSFLRNLNSMKVVGFIGGAMFLDLPFKMRICRSSAESRTNTTTLKVESLKSVPQI